MKLRPAQASRSKGTIIWVCEQVSVQPKPAGGYVVWVDGEGWNTMITFDSDTQLFTLLPQNYETGEVVAQQDGYARRPAGVQPPGGGRGGGPETGLRTKYRTSDTAKVK